MNLGQLQIAVANLGYDVQLTAPLTQFINDTYHEVVSGDRWPFLEKSTTQPIALNASSAALPADVGQIDAVRFTDALGNYWNTINLEPQDYQDKLYSYASNAGGQVQPVGTPQYWTLLDNLIQFFPYADKAYTMQIDYVYVPADLVGGTDTPVLPTVFHDVLVYGAAWKMAQRERDIYSTQTWQGVYQMKLGKMREAYLLRQRQTSSTVKKSGFFGSRRNSGLVW